MNIILFTSDEITGPGASQSAAALALPRADPRAAHILDVLRRKPGDTFDAGIIDGPRGKATLAAIAPEALALTFAWGAPPPPLAPITLLIGMPRPQTARKILNEAAALGVAALHFTGTERGEPSYAQSTLWTSGEYRRHLAAGAAQAFCTRIPRIGFSDTLAGAIAAIDESENTNAPAIGHARRIALDNYESPAPLSVLLENPPRPATAGEQTLVLAFGSERGWTGAERNLLRASHFVFAHLGGRVLRAETAVTAAIALTLAHLEKM